MLGPGLYPVPLGESPLLYHDAVKPLVPQGSTIVSYTYHYYISTLRHHIFVYSYVTSSCRETEFKTMLFPYFNDAKLRVK